MKFFHAFLGIVRKTSKTNLKGCDKCYYFSHGKIISEDDKVMFEHNTLFMDTRDEGSLM